MTSLAAAISIDSRGPCALYIVSDSRITWRGLGGHWDVGQKTFASRTTPHIFGFCGNAAFPPAALRQVIELLDMGVLDDCESSEVAHARFIDIFNSNLSAATNKFFDGFSILHGSREGAGMKCKFRLWKTDYFHSTDKLYDQEVQIEQLRSCFIRIDGSGRSIVQDRFEMWNLSEFAGTTRAAMWSFCEALSSGKDNASGGAPQLVGLKRVGPSERLGMIWAGKRYVSGMEVLESDNVDRLNWFNEAFERCSGKTGTRLEKASIHSKGSK
ncbi:hypothetical protein [Rhizobium leguminosarum]